ncbi:hypothetical protein IZ6_27090 [Terrihabitans soli]|uniref:DUF305 domain-containing protein n=1 Tax=Terrihabitans soli TaxID=708113 RepID=A0A6S6QN89_9HYPH|nr:DUF305 domain-containing protein [Terrihabitans soli]BCJ91974.1 hypothetical protein IZ6_27090 [Terrihabitans soli]
MLKYVFALSLAMTGTAFAQDHGAHGGHAAPVGDPAYAAQMKAHEKMSVDMGAVKPSGNPDVDFVRMMIPHHQGAIDMAEAELKFGKDESRKALARQIIEAQTKEIAEMKDWLAKNAK